MGLFLNYLFWSIDPRFYSFANAYCIHYCRFIQSFKTCQCESFNFVLFLKIVLAILFSFSFYIKFRIWKFLLSIVTITTKFCWDFHCYCIKFIDYFGENWHLYYIESSNPCSWYVSPFISSLKSFIRILQLSAYKSYTSLLY